MIILSSTNSTFLSTMCLMTIMLFKQNYLFSPAEALTGLIWSKNESDFVRISSIQSFEEINQQYFSISRKSETHDFNGTEFKITSFPIENLVNFVSNGTVVTGIHGDTWQLLSEMLNFKIHGEMLKEQEYGTRDENGRWSGMIGHIYRNETDIIPRCVISPLRLSALDYTFATWMTTYRFYMKKQPQYHKTWMGELFDRELWLSIVGLFFLLTLASFSIQVFNSTKKNSRHSIHHLRDHVFYIFSIFCNQGWTPRQLEKRAKILIISTRLFAWLLVIAFSSKLISHIAQRKFQPPFDDLESFYKNTDYKLIVKGNSFIYSVFQTSRDPIYKMIIDAGRIIQADSMKASKKMCTGRYVYLESMDVVEAEDAKPCEITVVGKPYFNTWIAGGLVRGFKYRKSIDLGMLKLFEFGIMDRVKLKWLKNKKVIGIVNSFESIRLEHVSLIFLMLGMAIAASLVILLIENIFYLGSIHNPRRRWKL